MNKRQALTVLPDIIESAKTNTHAQNLLIVPDLEEFSRKELMKMEYECIGVYISDDPLATYRETLKTLTPILDLAEHVGKPVHIGGRVSTYKEITTKKGQKMAFLTLEDLASSVEIVIFPYLFKRYEEILEENAVIELRGKVESSTHTIGDQDVHSNKVIADKIRIMEETKELKSISIPIRETLDLDSIKKILDNNQGPVGVELIYFNRICIPIPGGISNKGIAELTELTQLEKVYDES